MRRFLAFASMLFAAQCTLPTDMATRGPGRAVVFDIDGTLTPRVRAIFTARPGAAAAVNRYANAGYHIIYLSARAPVFQPGLQGWLARKGFPQGDLRVAQSSADNRDPTPFKTRVLAAYVADGWELVAAHGDSGTDFSAYAAAGLPASSVFALQRHGQDACQPGPWRGCYKSWADVPYIGQ